MPERRPIARGSRRTLDLASARVRRQLDHFAGDRYFVEARTGRRDWTSVRMLRLEWAVSAPTLVR